MRFLEKLSYISEMNRLSLMFNLAAVFIISGIIWQTGIYRKRGKLEDKLFFSAEILLIAMAMIDMIGSVLNGQGAPAAAALNHISNHVFFILFALICGMLALFFAQRARGGYENNRQKRILFMLPAFAEIAAILTNSFTGSFFYIDSETKAYTLGHLYGLIYIVPVFYVILSIIMSSKSNPGSIWFFLLIIVVRMLLGLTSNGVSSTSVCLAIGLAYIQIHIALEPFYEEDEI